MTMDSTATSPVAFPSEPDPRLVVLGTTPLNAEAPLDEQIGVITPSPLFYVRNHFPTPMIAADDWRLMLGGAIAHPLTLTYDQVRTLPSRTVLTTLECAGNGRNVLHPAAEGEPWGYGAASTAEWTGIPLGTLLDTAGVQSGVVQIVIDGADQGPVPAAGGEIRFAHALPLDKARDPDTLLAYAMNGEPLAPNHGFPLRLVVPGWYGMCSVKWVTRITAVTEPFQGFYQVDRYVMTHPERGDPSSTPLEAIRVRSLITIPSAGATLPCGTHRVRGLAWSGAAPITQVEASADGGSTWETAELTSPAYRYAWRCWEWTWHATAAGPVELRCRAMDEAGNAQPAEPEWNRLGYANNAIQTVTVTVG